MVPIPKNENGWLKEIAKAYIDALDTIPFAESIGERIEQKDLFHLAPVITIKFRGMKRSEKLLDKITKGALASYIANEESHKESLESPIIRFAFCYLASHYVLDLVNDETLGVLMDAIESDPFKLQEMIFHRNKR